MWWITFEENFRWTSASSARLFFSWAQASPRVLRTDKEEEWLFDMLHKKGHTQMSRCKSSQIHKYAVNLDSGAEVVTWWWCMMGHEIGLSFAAPLRATSRRVVWKIRYTIKLGKACCTVMMGQRKMKWGGNLCMFVNRPADTAFRTRPDWVTKHLSEQQWVLLIRRNLLGSVEWSETEFITYKCVITAQLKKHLMFHDGEIVLSIGPWPGVWGPRIYDMYITFN